VSAATTVLGDPRPSKAERITIQPGTWLPIDRWIELYERARDPSGKYGSLGTRSGMDGWGIERES
jgi:hypothetical protein